MALSAAEVLSADVSNGWKNLTGLEIVEGLGSTEVLHIYVSTRAGRAKPGSTGLPVGGFDVRIIDESGAEIAKGGTGDLIVRGDRTLAEVGEEWLGAQHHLRPRTRRPATARSPTRRSPRSG